MAIANEESVLGDFSNKALTFHNMQTRMFEREGNFYVATPGPDNEIHEYRISYTFGFYPLQQYLVELEGGHIQALNIAWDSRDEAEGGQRWIHLQPDEAVDTGSPFYWQRQLQNWNSRCAECHSTNIQKNFDESNLTYQTSWSEMNVACEACHGPGSSHVQLAGNGLTGGDTGIISGKGNIEWVFRDGKTIADPVGRKSTELVDICGGCHSRRAIIGELETGKNYHDQYQLATISDDLYFADGQIRDEVYVLGSFMQSKMYERGVTCTNCHEPHTGKLLLVGNSLCSQCHQADEFDTPSHYFHASESAGSQCVECHMPQRIYMQVDARRDHRFGIPDPAASMGSDIPNACNSCHKGTSAAWAVKNIEKWTSTLAKPHADTVLVEQARSGDPTTTRPILALVADESKPTMLRASMLSLLANFPSRVSTEAAEAYLNHAEPLLRASAVRLVRSVSPEVRWKILSSYVNDPVKAVRMEVAIALSDMASSVPLEKIGEFVALMNEYRQSLSLSADMPSTQSALGHLELNLGDTSAAIRRLEKAIKIEPDYIPARLNLADLYRSINNEKQASIHLQYAVKVAPDSGAANFSYGLSLIRQQKYQQAISYLKAATEQGDASSRYAYVYAVALDSLSRTDEALLFLENANRRWQNQYALLLLQIQLMEKTGDVEDILLPLSKLSRIAPGAPETRRLIKQYVQQPGG